MTTFFFGCAAFHAAYSEASSRFHTEMAISGRWCAPDGLVVLDEKNDLHTVGSFAGAKLHGFGLIGNRRGS